MTSAFQTGQFHTGSSDRPAVEPSLFASLADTPYQGVQAEESVTLALAEAAQGNLESKEEEVPEEEPYDPDTSAREKAQQTDADHVEALREEQLSTEPTDEKQAKAVTKENEELQAAAHAAYTDALEVAEKKDAETAKKAEAEAKKPEPEAKKADSKTAEKK